MSRAPNILLVMANQLVPFLTGAYGHPVVRTPSLDRLAAAGIRFDAVHTPYPLWSPAGLRRVPRREGARSVPHGAQRTLEVHLRPRSWGATLRPRLGPGRNGPICPAARICARRRSACGT